MFFYEKMCFSHFDRIMADGCLKTLMAHGFSGGMDYDYGGIDKNKFSYF